LLGPQERLVARCLIVVVVVVVVVVVDQHITESVDKPRNTSLVKTNKKVEATVLKQKSQRTQNFEKQTNIGSKGNPIGDAASREGPSKWRENNNNSNNSKPRHF
jgi:hypothetical protein